MHIKIVANGLWNNYTAFMPDMSTSYHTHSAGGMQIQTKETRTTETNYELINTKK